MENGVMFCVLENAAHLFWNERRGWTSEIGDAQNFASVREAMNYRQRRHLTDSHPVVFRGRMLERIDIEPSRNGDGSDD